MLWGLDRSAGMLDRETDLRNTGLVRNLTMPSIGAWSATSCYRRKSLHRCSRTRIESIRGQGLAESRETGGGCSGGNMAYR